MQILPDAPLEQCNTLRLPARAEYLCEVQTQQDLHEALAFARARSLAVRVLGGGSNVVLRERIAGLVVQMRMQGEEILVEEPQRVVFRVAAGMDWHRLVLDCHRRGWHGLENLALIPGTVGAAPMQNIGAYGLEIAEFVHEVCAVDRESGETVRLDRADCGFGYRHSVFREALAERVVITSVSFGIERGRAPRTDYPALRAELAAGAAASASDVLDAVIRIRRARLPDPAVLPNAGSFFKNPVITAEDFERLRGIAPGVAHWPYGQGYKLAAAWLVEHAGCKEMRSADAGVHARQALVLVNHGRASAADMLALATRIQDTVRERFGIGLELEPVVY